MTRLQKDAAKSPYYHIVLVILFGVGISSIPLEKVFGGIFPAAEQDRLFWAAAVRLALFAAAAVLSVKYGFGKQFAGSGGALCYVALFPALLVAVNNFPFVGFINGGAEITAGALHIALYFIYCFAVAAFEETLFRGIVFPLTFVALKNKKRRLFWAVALSSAFFGGAHIFNLFGGGSLGGTALQVGYSFLLGALCAISAVTVKNIYVPIFFHFIYDVGGFFFDADIGLCTGRQWDTLTVCITAVLGVLAAVYMTVLLLKTKDERAHEVFGTELYVAEETLSPPRENQGGNEK